MGNRCNGRFNFRLRQNTGRWEEIRNAVFKRQNHEPV